MSLSKRADIEPVDRRSLENPLPRVPYLPIDLTEPADIVAPIRKRRGGTLFEPDRVVLHAPQFARGWNAIAQAVRHEMSLSAKLRELAICAVGMLNHAEYEVEKHAPEFYKAGGKPEQIAALADVPTAIRNVALFDAAERATLQLSLEMTRDVEVTDATFAAVKAMLPSNQQVVELVGTVGFYNMISRVLVALHIEKE